MKIFKTFSFIALATLAVPAITSCKDDDPNNGDDADKDIVEVAGERVTSIGNINFKYDNKGRVIEVASRNYDDYIEIDYSKGTIEIDDEEGTIKFDKNGLISEISISYDDDDYGYIYKGSGTLKFSYDSKRLVSIVSSYSEKETDVSSGETENWNGTEKCNYTWNNGNLVKAEGSYEDYLEGELEYSNSYSFTVSYGETANKYKQFPYLLAYEIVDFEGLEPLVAIGLLGEGPAYLPETVSEGNYNTTLSFTLNENGSIASESGDGSTYAYTYSNISTKSALENSLSNEKFNVRSLFVGKNRRK